MRTLELLGVIGSFHWVHYVRVNFRLSARSGRPVIGRCGRLVERGSGHRDDAGASRCQRSRGGSRGLVGLLAGVVEEDTYAFVEAEASPAVQWEDPRRVGSVGAVGVHGEGHGEVVDVAPRPAVTVGIDSASSGHPEIPVTCAAGRCGDDGQSAFVDERVVPAAEQDEVVEIGRSAVRPGADVVGVKVRGGMAARELAYALVADPEGATLGTGGKAFRTAQAQHVAPARHECALDPCRTQQALRRGGLDRTMTLDEARTSLDRRSRGNVAGRGENVPAGTSRASALTWTITTVWSSAGSPGRVSR